MNWGAIGAIVLCLAVALGAFGAHGLRGRLDEYSMGVYEKAVFYQFVHGIGLLLAPLLAKSAAITAPAASRVCVLFLSGILLFSGSLYALVLTGTRAFGIVTPFGGLAFIFAWGLLAYELLRRRPPPNGRMTK